MFFRVVVVLSSKVIEKVGAMEYPDIDHTDDKKRNHFTRDGNGNLPLEPSHNGFAQISLCRPMRLAVGATRGHIDDGGGGLVVDLVVD